MNPLKNKALKKTANIMSLAFLATLPSVVYAKEYNVEYAGNNITICHHPSSNDPVTQSIDPNDWVDHKGHGDIPGACGILAGEGDFSDKPVFYALSDDTDIMNVYTFGSSDVIPASGDKFPDELENLTEAQGGTYYALTSKSGGAASLYEITMKQEDDCSFTSSYIEVFKNLEARNYNALELIDGDFYAPNNKKHKWIKFGLDGVITAERSFADAMSNIPKKVRDSKIQDTAYDPVNNIFYASHVWNKKKHNGTHLLAFDLSNGFENMVAIDKGTIFWEKIEGLLFKDGVLYGAAGHEDVIFEIIQDDNGNIVGDGKGKLFPGWDGDQAADLEGLANALLNKNCIEKKPQTMCSGDLSWKNEGANRFIHWGVEHKMVHEDDHRIFDSSSLPASLTNPPAEGTKVTVNLGSWEERTPNVNDGWQPGEQINVVFLDAADNIIWRSGFTDDLPDTSPDKYVSASITESVVINQAVDKVYIAHKSHSTYNQKLDWIGSVFPDYLCLNIDDTPPPPPALNFGSEGRFNIREVNTHKVKQHSDGGGVNTP